MRIPIDVMVNAIKNITSMALIAEKIVTCTPTKGARSSMIVPWIVATVAPPSALPITIDQRETGATKTSFKKPNSRSQTIDMAENTEVKSTVMQMMPGKMKAEKFTPCGPLTLGESAVPKTKRKRMGWPKDAKIRALSYQ